MAGGGNSNNNVGHNSNPSHLPYIHMTMQQRNSVTVPTSITGYHHNLQNMKEEPDSNNYHQNMGNTQQDDMTVQIILLILLIYF